MTFELMDVDLDKLAADVLNDVQRQRLDELPPSWRDSVYQYLQASLAESARDHLGYCQALGITDVVLERVIRSTGKALNEASARQQLIQDMVRGGASLPMLKSLLNVNEHEHRQARKALGDDWQKPKLPTLNDDQMTSLFHQWVNAGKSVSVDCLLALHQVSGYPLKTLWDCVQDWTHVKRDKEKKGIKRREFEGDAALQRLREIRAMGGKPGW